MNHFGSGALRLPPGEMDLAAAKLVAHLHEDFAELVVAVARLDAALRPALEGDAPVEIAPIVAFLDEAVAACKQECLERGVARELVAHEGKHHRILGPLPIGPQYQLLAPAVDGSTAGTRPGLLDRAEELHARGARLRREGLGEH